MNVNEVLAREFNLEQYQVDNTIELIDADNTIPFIARYRKELTGSLDDQVLRELFDRLTYIRGLIKRKEEVSSSITEQEKMTEEIQKAIDGAKTLAEVEDIYRPFKPKRKTRASVARERGLEPLAKAIFEQAKDMEEPLVMAEKFVNEELGVACAQDAYQGALDIIAEDISDNASVRKELRFLIFKHADITAKPAKDVKIEETVYSMYGEFSESVSRIAGHRVLALDRAEKEKMLNIAITMDKQICIDRIFSKVLKEDSPSTQAVKDAATDAYDRLIFPSLQTEVRNELTQNAAEKAIKVFSLNLRHLLMQPPIKNSVTLGLDPGFRTGCKVAVIDQNGKVLDHGVIYPTHSAEQVKRSKEKIMELIKKHQISVIAIGNGTASRETEAFVTELIKENKIETQYMIVNEAGASVYSASKLAAQEFPDFDVTIRGAISIARRMQDPLAELVKIDPKAIGVGQYQHDMPKKQLDFALSGVVEDCVNNVGVDLNSASFALLSYVSGINSTIAKNIVKYREENGAFKSRKQLMEVPKLGKKAFLQSAGFLRVVESENILDNTGVHPESYTVVTNLFKEFGINVKKTSIDEALSTVLESTTQENVLSLSEKLCVGKETLEDILKELAKPGRDPRDELPKPLLRSDVLDIADIKTGMILSGTVRNVIDFGAFIDIGVHEDGLVHISEIANKRVRHPSDFLKVGDIIKVLVLDVDVKKRRISLSIKQLPKEENVLAN